MSCGGGPRNISETPLGPPPPAGSPAAPRTSGGMADEIRSLVEAGTPPSLLRALDLIRSRELGGSEFGRTMSAVAVTFMRRLYPDIQTQLPPFDPPQTHVYTRVIRDAERGVYTPPESNSPDYLEYVLPFLAYLSETRGERLLSALPDLERARELKSDGVAAIYFQGLVYERSLRPAEARNAYTRAYGLSGECYPAALGLGRIMLANGELQDAVRLLTELLTRNPDNEAVKRQLALAYYENRDWSRSEQAVAEILQRNPRDGQFILIRAHIMVEQGQYLQAQAPLDLYATIDTGNRLYLLLRARVQSEGYHNRDAALNYLRSLLRAYPDDEEGAVYAAGLLMESHRAEDQAEGRALMRRLLEGGKASANIIDLALSDAIRRGAFRDAQPYLESLLSERRSSRDLLNAYTVQRGLGNNAQALSFARELYERDPSDEEGAAAYVSALIDTGRRDEAGRMIESRLAALPGGSVKSRYYYLRSRIRNGDESVMNDLRSSLFEDPRNLDALIAMFEIYHRRRDERRAVYYLKQALALSSDNPQLQRYQNEYASLLGAAF
ncbi:MAG: tetratricopeptide repeat protein [Spirochaetaceae bacterium]|nr:tetratricopeptide repeat protein [Spirochaetaceae bacterium]